MADESSQNKTEQATPRRLDRARQQGQVASSTELNTGLGLLAATLYLWILGPHLLSDLENAFRLRLLDVQSENWEIGDVTLALISVFKTAAAMLLPFVAIVLVVGVFVSVLQVGFRPSGEPLQMKFEKLNPVKGLSKLFSLRSTARGLFAIIKVSVICAALWWVCRYQADAISSMSGASMRSVMAACLKLALQLALASAAALVLIGLADLLFQKWQFMRDMQMSRQELVDERKDDEGDPHLRARMKRLQRELSLRNGIEQVASSTFVVRNPTHYAVAIKYERGKMAAPMVVAKGADFLALKIICLAEENKVPVVENRPLAQTLYRTVEIDQEIPVELYHAIAELLGYVYKLNSAA